MTRTGLIAAILLMVLVILLASRIWNPVENGQTITDPSPLIGCYGLGSDKLVIERERVVVLTTHQATKIIRFFYLKNDAAINTVNNLEYDASGNNLRVGDASTGFFYTFDASPRHASLHVPDDGGNVRTLRRIAC